MESRDQNDLGRRVRRLEREARCWRVLGVAVLAGIGVMALLGAAVSPADPHIKARSFILVDAEGRERAVLGLQQNGSAVLQLSDQAGENRIALYVKPGEAGLGMADSRGTPRVALSVGARGAALSLYDEQERGGVTLGAASSGATTLLLIDQAGKPRALLSSGKAQSPRLRLYDAEGKSIWKAP